MTRLEHINLVVKNIDATLAFLQTALPHWRVRGGGSSAWYGRQRRWLHFGDDEHYITLNDGAEGENRDLRGYAPGLAHVGVVVDDLAAVAQRLDAAGYTVATISADHPHRKSLYFHEPEGFEFEFVQYLSGVAAEKNQYGGETSTITRVGSA